MSLPRSFKGQKLLSINEVAAQMGVHRSTVWNWIRSDCLKATTPTVADPTDPTKQVPVSSKYRGVRAQDLARWKRVYDSGVSSDSPVPTSRKKKNVAEKRAKKKTRR